MRSRRAPPLPNDWLSSGLVLFVSVAMGFLAALAVGAAMGADALARSWTKELTARATVSLSVAARPEETVAQAVETIRAVPGVGSARAIEGEEQARLLAPWLGDDRELADLPLPRLIDVTGRDGLPPPVGAIGKRLAAAGFDAEVDAHGVFVERLEPAARQIRSFAYGALGIVSIAAALTVALACTAGLTAQSRIVDVLKLVGAEDRYIARIFVRRYQWLAFVGSGAGAAFAFLALMFAGDSGDSADLAPILPQMRPSGIDQLRFAVIPPAFALIATIAARMAVSYALRPRGGA